MDCWYWLVAYPLNEVNELNIYAICSVMCLMTSLPFSGCWHGCIENTNQKRMLVNSNVNYCWCNKKWLIEVDHAHELHAKKLHKAGEGSQHGIFQRNLCCVFHFYYVSYII
jgi:hypothetical protein